jgi:hypothetical protein
MAYAVVLPKVGKVGMRDNEAAEYEEEVDKNPSVADQRYVGQVAENYQMIQCNNRGGDTAPNVKRFETDSGCAALSAWLSGMA